MYQHHVDSIEKLKEYYANTEGVIAVILDGSVVKGNARPDSDIDAIVVVTDKKFAALKAEDRMTEIIVGHCTYDGGYFDVKYKTKALLEDAAERASEPTRNAYVKAQVVYSVDEEIGRLVEKIAAYPEREREKKIRCFQANLELNRVYFLNCVPDSNVYMRAHLAHEIVYSVYRLILAENRVLFPCNRRLEDAVSQCKNRPADILERGAAFLRDITKEKCDAFVSAFLEQTALDMRVDMNRILSDYTLYYEDWWREENPPFPNEW